MRLVSQLTEVKVTGYSPFIGAEGIEGVLIRTAEGEVMLLVGSVIVDMLSAGAQPVKPKRPRGLRAVS